MCLVSTPKATKVDKDEKNVPILRNPFLDGMSATIKAGQSGTRSLRIDRAAPGTTSAPLQASPGTSLIAPLPLASPSASPTASPSARLSRPVRLDPTARISRSPNTSGDAFPSPNLKGYSL